MHAPTRLARAWRWLCGAAVLFGGVAAQAAPPQHMNGILLDAVQATAERLAAEKTGGADTVALRLHSTTAAERAVEDQAAARVRAAGLRLYYWLEIARCPELAEAHPLWMASVQGHDEWRRFFPAAPKPRAREIVKAYPWVPVLYREGFAAQLARVKDVLRDRVAAEGVLLNDLQGGPSACGCGHPQCRWTTDYGPLRTGTMLEDDAPRDFVRAVRDLGPTGRVIPVWLTECEEHDQAERCGGIGCYKGLCWQRSVRQLVPLAADVEQIGLLLPVYDFERDETRYGQPAGWVAAAVKLLASQPARFQQPPIAADRVVCVLQGWDVTADQIAAQRARAGEAGVSGIIVSYVKIDQSWEPRLVPY